MLFFFLHLLVNVVLHYNAMVTHECVLCIQYDSTKKGGEGSKKNHLLKSLKWKGTIDLSFLDSLSPAVLHAFF